MLVALNKIGAQQANSTLSTKAKAEYIMDYASTHLNATVRFHAINIILHMDSDATYLVFPRLSVE